MADKIQTVGWIGLGNAGYPLAANLPRAGYQMVVRDADPERAEKFAKEFKDAKAASAEPDAFKDVDLLVTMLPNGKVVREVLLGEKGVAKHLKPGTIIVDTSSSSPFDTRELNSDLQPMKLYLIDSPITQIYLHAIDTGDATLMLGCDSKEALERAMPVLQTLSKYIYVMGGSGQGHAMKTLNNYVSVGSIIALNDALIAGQKFGLDPSTMIDVLNVGTGRNFSTAYSHRDEGLTRRYASGYQLELLIKDMKITTDLIKSVGFETEMPALSLKYLQDAMAVLEPGADHTECLKGWEHRAGIQLKKREQSANGVVKEDQWKE